MKQTFLGLLYLVLKCSCCRSDLLKNISVVWTPPAEEGEPQRSIQLDISKPLSLFGKQFSSLVSRNVVNRSNDTATTRAYGQPGSIRNITTIGNPRSSDEMRNDDKQSKKDNTSQRAVVGNVIFSDKPNVNFEVSSFPTYSQMVPNIWSSQNVYNPSNFSTNGSLMSAFHDNASTVDNNNRDIYTTAIFAALEQLLSTQPKNQEEEMQLMNLISRVQKKAGHFPEPVNTSRRFSMPSLNQRHYIEEMIQTPEKKIRSEVARQQQEMQQVQQNTQKRQEDMDQQMRQEIHEQIEREMQEQIQQKMRQRIQTQYEQYMQEEKTRQQKQEAEKQQQQSDVGGQLHVSEEKKKQETTKRQAQETKKSIEEYKKIIQKFIETESKNEQRYRTSSTEMKHDSTQHTKDNKWSQEGTETQSPEENKETANMQTQRQTKKEGKMNQEYSEEVQHVPTQGIDVGYYEYYGPYQVYKNTHQETVYPNTIVINHGVEEVREHEDHKNYEKKQDFKQQNQMEVTEKDKSADVGIKYRIYETPQTVQYKIHDIKEEKFEEKKKHIDRYAVDDSIDVAVKDSYATTDTKIVKDSNVNEIEGAGNSSGLLESPADDLVRKFSRLIIRCLFNNQFSENEIGNIDASMYNSVDQKPHDSAEGKQYEVPQIENAVGNETMQQDKATKQQLQQSNQQKPESEKPQEKKETTKKTGQQQTVDLEVTEDQSQKLRNVQKDQYKQLVAEKSERTTEELIHPEYIRSIYRYLLDKKNKVNNTKASENVEKYEYEDEGDYSDYENYEQQGEYEQGEYEYDEQENVEKKESDTKDQDMPNEYDEEYEDMNQANDENVENEQPQEYQDEYEEYDYDMNDYNNQTDSQQNGAYGDHYDDMYEYESEYKDVENFDKLEKKLQTNK